jgi:hypothetical protein
LRRIGGKEDDMVVDEAEAMYAIPSEYARLASEIQTNMIQENIWVRPEKP